MAVSVLLTVAGFQVPVMPLSEVIGRTGAAAPAQNDVATVNAGITVGVTVTVKVPFVEH